MKPLGEKLSLDFDHTFTITDSHPDLFGNMFIVQDEVDYFPFNPNLLDEYESLASFVENRFKIVRKEDKVDEIPSPPQAIQPTTELVLQTPTTEEV